MSDRIVRIIITGDSAGAVKAMREAEVASGSFATRAEKLGGSVTKVGRSLAMFSLPLVAVGGYAVKSAVDFQSSMKLIETQTRASAGEVATQSKKIMKLAGQVGTSPEELAKGLYPIESNNNRGVKAYNMLKAAAIGAAVGHDTLAETSSAVSAAMKVQLKDVHSASQAMGILDAIVGHGKMLLPELTESMKSGILSAAKTLGLSLRSVGAAMDVMTSRGVPAATAATRLRTDLVRMIAPSKEGVTALAKIGLEQYSLAKALHKPNGLLTALTELHNHMRGLRKVEQNKILSELFGKSKGASTMMELTSALPEMGKLIPKLQSHLMENFAHTRESAAFKLAAMMAKLKAALVQLGNVLMPVVIPAVIKLASVLGGLLHAFTRLPKPVRSTLLVMAGVVAVLGPLLILTGKLITAVGGIVRVFKDLKLALVVNPEILLIIAAFAALGVAVYIVATHFQKFKTNTMAVFRAVASFVKSVFDSMVNGVIRSLDLVIGAINAIIKGYDAIPGFLRPTGAVSSIGMIKEVGGGASTAERAVLAVGRPGGAARHPALAGAGGGNLRLNNKIYVNRRAIGRPMAEATTEYALKRKAREG